MSDADLNVRFGADVTGLNAAFAQAKASLAAFAPAATGTAKSGLDAFNSTMRDSKAASDTASTSWKDNLVTLAAFSYVATQAKASVGSLFADIANAAAVRPFENTIAGAKVLATTLQGMPAATRETANAIGEAASSFGEYFTSAAAAERGTRLFAQANETVRASIGSVILSVQQYLAAVSLLSDGTAQAQAVALAAGGNFGRFADAVSASGGTFGSITNTLSHFTTELARIPGMSKDAAVSIQAVIGAIPNMDIATNDLIIQYLQEVSKNADDAKQHVQTLATALKSDTGGTDLADSLTRAIDFTKLDTAKGKLQDLAVLAKSLGQKFADPGQAKAFFDTLIQKSSEAGAGAEQTLKDQIAAAKEIPILGRLAVIPFLGQVEAQVALNTQLAQTIRLLQDEASAAGKVTAAVQKQKEYEDAINADSTRVGRMNKSEDTTKALNNGSTQGRKEVDAPTGDERDLLIRTVIGEGGGEIEKGIDGILSVIKNRVESGYGGAKSYTDVVTAPKQFSVWNPGDPAGAYAKSVSPDSAVYQKIAAALDKMTSGNLEDPTKGATSYYNPRNADPDWGRTMTNRTTIGNHDFGNTAGSPKVRDDDDDAMRNEGLQKQVDIRKKIADEARGGTEADVASLAIAEKNASEAKDEVEDAESLVAAKKKDLAAAQGGSPTAIRTSELAVYQAEQGLREKQSAQAKAANDLQVAQAREGSQQRLDLTLAGLNKEQEAYTEGSAKYNEIEKQKYDATKAFNEKRAEDAAAAENVVFDASQRTFKNEQDLIRDDVRARALSQTQGDQLLAASLDRQRAAVTAHYAALAQIYAADPEKQRKAQQQGAVEQNKINQEALNDTRRANAEMVQSYVSAFERIGQSVSSSLMGMLQGTTNFRTLMKNVATSVVQMFLDAGVKMVADWAANQTKTVALSLWAQAQQTSAVVTGTAARTGAEAAGSASSFAVQGAAMVKSILGSASETIAGVFGFLSPVMGPAAAAPAAAAGATVSALAGSVVAFDVGSWQLPSTGLAMVHQGEMIVPAGQTPWAQSLMANGGASGAGGDTHNHFSPTVNFHNHGSAKMSPQDLRDHAGTLVDIMKKEHKRGAFNGFRGR